jgi:hypothetical protein
MTRNTKLTAILEKAEALRALASEHEARVARAKNAGHPQGMGTKVSTADITAHKTAARLLRSEAARLARADSTRRMLKTWRAVNGLG